MKKLWGGRFTKNEDLKMKDFDNSMPYGKKMYKEDIEGSIAHAKMLGKTGIVTQNESQKMVDGLKEILAEIESGELEVDDHFEDIHSFTEIILTEKIGDIGKKLHTARSRNDQVAVDQKLYCKKIANKLIASCEQLKNTLIKKGEENPYIMPGYTHLQRAQAVTFKYHLMAYAVMMERDIQRLNNTITVMDVNPLGAGALAGTTHAIDRDYTTELLGFSRKASNFIDAVSDRDFMIELLSDCSIIMVHLSRLSEELILWSSEEFKFIKIDEAYATGSSIMPQKMNPDAAELVRGSSGIIFGSLMSLLTIMKGLPLSYNKDLQLDKNAVFPAVEQTLDSLEIMSKMISTMKVQEKQMGAAVRYGYLNATEVADYLVKKGLAFRDAHDIVGKIVIIAEQSRKTIEEMSLNELQSICDKIEEDIYKYIDFKTIMQKGIKKEML